MDRYLTWSDILHKPGTLNSAPFVGCRCPRVADANFAPGGRQYMGSPTDANDAYQCLPIDSRW